MSKQASSTASQRARRHREGFTLIELLTVLGITGILITMLLPSVRRSMHQASSTVCLHNLRELGRSLHEYRLDHRGWLPQAMDEKKSDGTPGSAAPWYGPLFPKYLGNPSAVACPADPARSMIDGTSGAARRSGAPDTSSYGMNNVIRAAGLGNLDRHGPASPLETILLADMGPDIVVDGFVDRNDGWLPWDDGFQPAFAGLRDSWLTGRHFGHINVLTIGGAAKRVRTQELMEDRISNYYGDCASGGCPLCSDYELPHYSFAPARLFWWTGAINRAD